MQPASPKIQTGRFVPFAFGFRPFFLLAGWSALLGIGAWMWMYGSGRGPLPGLPPQLWHGHEMLHGFVPAAIAGFMLTAVPGWTGSRGFGGPPLLLLTIAWLLGRIGFASAGVLPFYLLAIFELAFLPLVAALIAPPLLRARNRNRPLLLVLFVLWACDVAFLLALRAGDAAL
ncbi:MAG TPA: NnrS family protein, partial [Xanthomonadales bacterium]|nr:NnrS family protein [Xanthomonadales bacterium]